MYNAVTGPLGAILTYGGGKMLQSGNMWGFVALVPGVALDAITVYNINKIFKIGDNAEMGIQSFCDCSVFDKK